MVSESFYFCFYWNLPDFSGLVILYVIFWWNTLASLYPWNFKLQYKRKWFYVNMIVGFYTVFLSLCFCSRWNFPRLLWTGDTIHHLLVRICNKSWFNRGVDKNGKIQGGPTLTGTWQFCHAFEFCISTKQQHPPVHPGFLNSCSCLRNSNQLSYWMVSSNNSCFTHPTWWIMCVECPNLEFGSVSMHK